MFSSSEKIWIEAGYAMFGEAGPSNLKTEVLARRTGVSKSSFYHHFADMELFIDRLMTWHLCRARELAQEAEKCQTINPEFIGLLFQVQKDLLFNRMLRIHRSNMAFQLCFNHAHSMVAEKILPVWAIHFKYEDAPHVALDFFGVVADVFYSRMSSEGFDMPWIISFFEEMESFIHNLRSRSGFTVGLTQAPALLHHQSPEK